MNNIHRRDCLNFQNLEDLSDGSMSHPSAVYLTQNIKPF